jgi:tripartite-type tricarboxylate transporter receptor subunit TctC
MDARTLIVERDACAPRTAGTRGPDTPPDIVRLLRAALQETLQAPEFLADARRANLEVDPVSGEQLEQVIAELFGLNGSVVSKLRELLQ